MLAQGQLQLNTIKWSLREEKKPKNQKTHDQTKNKKKLVFWLCPQSVIKKRTSPPWAVWIDSLRVKVVHLPVQSAFNICSRSGEKRGWKFTHIHTKTHIKNTITTKLLKYTYTYFYCAAIIYTRFQASLWSNESHSLKGEKSNRIAQLGAKWLSGGQYFISTATASKVEREV